MDSSLVGSLTREDGSLQVTYNGWPLYYYGQDENAGDVEGQDIEDFGAEWYLVTPAGEKVEEEGEHEEGEESTEGTQVATGPTVGLELIVEGLTHPVMLAEPPDFDHTSHLSEFTVSTDNPDLTRIPNESFSGSISRRRTTMPGPWRSARTTVSCTSRWRWRECR